MALTKISTAMISQSAAAVDLNVDAGTFYVDTTNNRVGVGGKTDPDTPLHVIGTATATTFAGSGASLTDIPNSALTNSSITINSNAVSLGGSLTLTTANIGENTNLYYTDARADARIAAADTDDLSEGSSNLYYTDARVDARVSGGSLGNITTTGYIRGPATFTIDPAAHGDNTGTVVIAGNLQVDGTTTTINSTTMTVDDLNITLASGSANAAAANGAGFTVDIGSGTNPAITYDGTNDEWDFNKDINVTGNATFSGTANPIVRIEATANNDSSLFLTEAGTGNVGAQLLYDGGDNKLYFKVGNNTDLTRMTIERDTGNVGIGSTSPSSNFRASIKGDYSSIIGGIEFDSGGGDKFTIGHATATSPSGMINVVGAANLIFKTSNTEAMRIDANGKVGIGTASPSQKLEVNGPLVSTDQIASPGSAGSYTYNATALDYSSNGARMWSWGSSSARGTFNFIQLENDGTNQQTALTINSSGNATFAGTISSGAITSTSSVYATEFDLPSGGMLDWANGDARIVEGLVNNYSLSFQTYDGSNATTALRLDGDNSATFAGAISSGAITSGSHLINASSSAFGGSSVQGFNTDFLVDSSQGYSRHNSYHTGGSNHQFLVNATGSTTNTVALAINKDANATFAGTISSGAITSTGAITGASFINTAVRYIANQIQSGYGDNSDNSDIWINYTGYQGGTTYFRDFRVGNGKQAQLFFVDGSAGNVSVTNALTVGSTISSGALTSSGTGTFEGGGNTLTLKKGTGTPALAFAGTASDPEATALIEGISGGGLKIYTSSGTISSPSWSPKFTLAANGNATFAGTISSGAITSTGKVQGNSLKAHVGTDDGSQLNLFADASGHCFIAGHTLSFNVGANSARARKMIISNTGQVGIGTGATVSAPLDLETAGNTTDGTYYSTFTINNTGSSTWSRIRFDRSGVAKWGLSLATDDKFKISNLFTAGSVSNADDEVLVIDNNSKIGIGLSSPTAKLSIKGQTHTTPWLAQERSGSATVQFRIVSAENSTYTAGSGTVSPVWTTVMDSYNADIMLSTFLAGGTGGSIILDGNVGIGTTSPSEKLHIGGTAPGDSIIRQDATSSGTNWEIGERVAGKYQFWEDDGDNVRLTIMSTGNVGIGTESPLSLLHIEGNTNGYNTSPLLYFGSTSTVNAAVRDWAIGPADSNYGNFHIFQGASTGASAVGTSEIAFTIDSNKNVGIDMQTPGPYKLNVNGETKTLGLYSAGTTNLGTNGGDGLSDKTIFAGYGVLAGNGVRYGNYGNLIFRSSSGYTGGARSFLITNGYNANKFAIIQSTTHTTIPDIDGAGGGANNGVPRFVIDNSGLIGIGTSGPTAALTVNGQITGGFGGATTAGTADWNHSTNARSGMGYTLLLGNATNGPSGTAVYFHCVNYEYGSKDGSGNLTQVAIGYNTTTQYIRYRYSGSWSSWTQT